MNSVLNLKESRLVQGDPNTLRENQVLVEEDPNTGKISLYKRINGVVESIVKTRGGEGNNNIPLNKSLKYTFENFMSSLCAFASCINIQDFKISDEYQFRTWSQVPTVNEAGEVTEWTFESKIEAIYSYGSNAVLSNNGVIVPVTFAGGIIPTLNVPVIGVPEIKIPVKTGIPGMFELSIDYTMYLDKMDYMNIDFTILIKTGNAELINELEKQPNYE